MYIITFINSLLKLEHAFITLTIYKNSAEVDIAPAFGEITTACKVSYQQASLLQRYAL